MTERTDRRKYRMNWILWCCALLTPTSGPASVADDLRPTVVIVLGAEGEAEYGQTFSRSADRWALAAGRAGARVVQIGRDDITILPATAPATTRPSSTTTTTQPSNTDRDRLRSVLEAESKPDPSAAPPRPL